MALPPKGGGAVVTPAISHEGLVRISSWLQWVRLGLKIGIAIRYCKDVNSLKNIFDSVLVNSLSLCYSCMR